MDLSQGKLQQLIMVARCGGFSKAAAELNISQPALSRSIAAIEARYGFQIFNRMGHGVKLTAAGAQVIAQAEPLLRSLMAFDNNLRLFGAGEVGELAFGLAPLLASQLLALFAGDFFTPQTRAHLRVMIRPGADLLDQLRNDAIEMFLFPESQIDAAPEIDIAAVGTIAPVCVVRRGHPLAGRGRLTMADLADHPWASAVDPPFAAEMRNPARFVCDNYHILRDAILRSDLVGICSAAFVAAELADGRLHAIRVEGLSLTTATIYVAKLRGRMLSPLAEQALKRLRTYLDGG